MKYDFTTTIDRRSRSAAKWLGMDAELPNLEAGIIPFSVADLDMPIAPEIKERLSAYLSADGCFGYTSPSEEFYRAVVNWMKKRHDWQIEKEWIVNTAGVMHAVNIVINEFSEEGEGVILFSPVYHPFFMAIKENKRQVVDCPLIDDNGNYYIDWPNFERVAQNDKNRVLIFCSPHNPVGRVWEKEELSKVISICQQNNILLLTDEIHADFAMPTHHHYPIAKIAVDSSVQLITCTAPSKSFNLAGLQLSNIIIEDSDLRERFESRQRRSGVESLNCFSYKACELAYDYGEAWLDELIALVYSNYQMVVAYLNEHWPAVRIFPLQGTYLLWLDWGTVEIPNRNIIDFIIKEAKVFVTKGDKFSEGCSNFMRLQLAAPSKDLQEALERIRRALAQYGK